MGFRVRVRVRPQLLRDHAEVEVLLDAPFIGEATPRAQGAGAASTAHVEQVATHEELDRAGTKARRGGPARQGRVALGTEQQVEGERGSGLEGEIRRANSSRAAHLGTEQ